MNVRILSVRLEGLSGVAEAWQDALPYALRVEASEDDGRRLVVEPQYRLDFRRAEGSLTHPRWSLTYDGAKGRILKIAFDEGRDRPMTPYDELLTAFRDVRAYVMQVAEGRPCHFGLWIASSALGLHFSEHEIALRAALASGPPSALN